MPARRPVEFLGAPAPSPGAGWIRRLLVVLVAVSLSGGATVGTAHAQWTEPPGEGWMQVSIFHQDTRRQFTSDAHVEPIFDDGHAINTSVYITGAIGLLEGLDSWVQVPFHRLEFNDVVGERVRTGLGEPKIYLRAAPSLFGGPDWPVAVRGGVKFPRELTVNAEIIPLGEGQRDWELMLELGHSFYPAPVYLQGWAGYRWREKNEAGDRKPGNEWFAFLAAGGEWNRFTWKLAVEGMNGQPNRSLGLVLPRSQRDFVQLLPKVGYRLGPGAIEVGVRLPVWGRNLLAGPALTLGYFFTFSDPLPF